MTLTIASVKLSPWRRVGYGVGMLGAQVFRDTPALLLLPFMTNTLAVAPALAGSAVLLPKLWVLFADPLAGAWSDRTASPWGRRRPFVLFGGLATFVGFALLFYVPALGSAELRAGYIATMYTLALTGFSLFSVPYLSMGSELSDDPRVRTELMAARVAFMSLGLVLSGYAGVVRDWGGGGVDGYRFMACVLAALGIASVIMTVLSTRSLPVAHLKPTSTTMGSQMLEVFMDPHYRPLLAAGFLQRLAEGCAYASLVYYLTYILGLSPAMLGTFVLAVASGSILSQPLCIRLASRWGSTPVYVLALLLTCMAFASWLSPWASMPHVLLGIGAATGVVQSAYGLMGLSLLSDVALSGRANERGTAAGMYSGMWLAAEKVAYALGTFLVGSLLEAAGYVASQSGFGQAQPSSVMSSIRFCFVGLPITFLLLSVYFVLRHERRRRSGRQLEGNHA